jgi:hypothetical protein
MVAPGGVQLFSFNPHRYYDAVIVIVASASFRTTDSRSRQSLGFHSGCAPSSVVGGRGGIAGPVPEEAAFGLASPPSVLVRHLVLLICKSRARTDRVYGPHEKCARNGRLRGKVENPCSTLKISLFFDKTSLFSSNKNVRRNRCGAHTSSLYDDLRKG